MARKKRQNPSGSKEKSDMSRVDGPGGQEGTFRFVPEEEVGSSLDDLWLAHLYDRLDEWPMEDGAFEHEPILWRGSLGGTSGMELILMGDPSRIGDFDVDAWEAGMAQAIKDLEDSHLGEDE